MINNLRYWRKHNGYTQKELAYICGVSRNTICSLERGEYLPGIILYKKLYHALAGYYGDIYNLSDEEISEIKQRCNEIYVKKHYPEDPCI